MSTWSWLSPRRGAIGFLAALVVLGVGTCVGASDEVPDRVVLMGTVVDEAGNPVAGAEVSATTRPRPETVKSGADGEFRLSLPANHWVRIFTTLIARGGDGRLGVLSVSQEREKLAPVTVILQPARTLDVRVVDGDGRPVEGAEVRFLMNLQEIVGGQTDAEGRWKENVPTDAKGWAVYALKSRIGFDYALAERARGSTEPPLPLPEQLTLTLDGARPPLRIKAVDGDGKPLTGVEVGPWLIQKPGRESQMNGMTGAFRKTDENGVAALDWLPARMEGTISIVSRSSSSYPPDHATWLPSDKPVDEVTITYLPYEQISGRVTTADGRPAADVDVRIEGQGAGDNTFHGAASTDAEGRFALKVYSEQAYIITALKDDMAAPYVSGVVVRAGKPVEGLDLVLGRATYVRGRVTVGADEKPVAGTSVQAMIDKGSIPPELQREGGRTYRGMSMNLWSQTDQEGRFEFVLGPGEYTIQGPARVEPIKLTIPTENPPVEIVQNLTMPRPETGPFTATVVDSDGNPVAGAVVKGIYASQEAQRWFHTVKADADGVVQVDRSLDPLVIHAETPDKTRAGMSRVDADAAEARIVVKPTATASGRLVDPEGKAIAGQKLSYGIRIHLGPTRSSPFSWNFGGATTTDDQGGFQVVGLVVGETYEAYASDAEGNRSFTAKTKITPGDGSSLALGDVTIDIHPQPYVPPTPAQRTAASFTARQEKTPQEKLAYTLTEARREYTRPLLLFGGPSDPACTDLFRLFEERPEDADEADGEPRAKTPAELRWEFELASLDSAQADVKTFAKDLGVALSDDAAPMLVVLSDEDKPSATFSLLLGSDKKLDALALGAFLLEHKLPTRDAEAMLAGALARAQAEDKRVFLIMSASWCGPCRLLARYLSAHKAELERHYVFVKLDVSRDTHAEDLRLRYEGKDAANGVPWYVILDAVGKPLITSNAKELEEEYGSTNIGFPSSKEGIDHFAGMLKLTAPRLSNEALTALRQSLMKNP